MSYTMLTHYIAHLEEKRSRRSCPKGRKKKLLRQTLLLLLLASWGFSFSALSQTIKGQVFSTEGAPLEGVIVSLVGGGSAVTDADGSFVLQPSDEQEKGTLRFAFDGYYPRVISWKKGADVQRLVLVPLSEKDYSGQVAMPMGIVPREQAAATLEGFYKKDFAENPSADLAWQDASPALQVIRKSGMPGEGGYVNIRGIHTLSAENTPLLVVNGVPYLANTHTSSVINAYSRDVLFGYNARDIRSISVLKGAEAAMYGSLGAGGVIAIETEQATSDNLDTRITFSGSYGLATAEMQLPVMGVGDYHDYLMSVGQTRYPSLYALQRDYPFLQGEMNQYSYLFDNTTDWTAQILRRGLVTDNVLRVEGGDEVAKYNISFGYTSEEGTLKGTASNRYHTAMNTHIMVSPKTSIFTSVNLAYLTGKLAHTGMAPEVNPMLAAYAMMPNLSPYEKLSDGGIINRYLKYNGWNVNDKPLFPYDNVSNPLAIVNTSLATDKIYDANIRLGMDYRLGQKWNLSALVNLYYDYTEEYAFIPGVTDAAIIPQLYGTGENYVGMGVVRQQAYFYAVNAAYRDVMNDKHSLQANMGARLMTKSYEHDASGGYNTANDYYRTLSLTTDEWSIVGDNDDWKLLSFYAQGDYIYDNLLKTSAGLTVDGTSVSGVDAPRFGWFPSASVTYMAAGNQAVRKYFDVLNITGQVSLTGNSRFSSNYAKNYYVSNNLFNLGTIVRNGVPNTSLEWEKKMQADFGVDMVTAGNRLGVRINGFFAHHYDLLLDSRISSVYGSNEPYYANTGAIDNTGTELSIRYNPIHNRKVDWILTASAAHVSSRLASLGERDMMVQRYTSFNNDDAQTLLKVGRSPYEFFGYQTAGVYATTAEAHAPTLATGAPLRNTYGNFYSGGDIYFVDQNNDGIINDADRVPLGDARPVLYGAFGSSLRYRSLTLSADFGYSLGNKAYNAVRREAESMSTFHNQASSVVNRWQIEGQKTSMPRAAYGDPSGNNFFSDRWIEDASFLKLRNVRLDYAFGRRLFGVVNGTVWASAENLWTLTRYLGGDPEFMYSYTEALRGFDYAKVTIPVTYKVGFNLNF